MYSTAFSKTGNVEAVDHQKNEQHINTALTALTHMGYVLYIKYMTSAHSPLHTGTAHGQPESVNANGENI